MYLLDTNVFSEWFKPDPDPNVIRFINAVEWMLPVPVLAEIQLGAERQANPARRMQLNNAIDATVSIYGHLVIDWDAETARTWGRLQFAPEVRTKPQAFWDSLIDAMAVRFKAIVATRNQKDFRYSKTFNPWEFSE